jgi:hypothetical protein
MSRYEALVTAIFEMQANVPITLVGLSTVAKGALFLILLARPSRPVIEWSSSDYLRRNRWYEHRAGQQAVCIVHSLELVF